MDELAALRKEVDAAFAQFEACASRLKEVTQARDPILRQYEAEARKSLLPRIDGVVADVATKRCFAMSRFMSRGGGAT